jgi:hypothetical protein
VLTFARAGRRAKLVCAILLLNASVTFHNLWPTPLVRWQADLSVELAFGMLLLAAAAWSSRLGPQLLRGMAVAWTALVIGRYVEVTAPALYGREINLYWDARHLSAVAAMLSFSWSGGLVVAGIAGLLLTLVGLYMSARWAWGRVAEAAGMPHSRRWLVATAGLIVAAYAGHLLRAPELAWETLSKAELASEEPPPPAPIVGFTPPASLAYARQARTLLRQVATRRVPAAGASTVPDSDLSRVQGADVFLVFVESYGAVAFDRAEFASQFAPARAAFEAAVRDTGRQIVSSFAESPTFGGGSWLAHISFMTGVETRDEDTNVALMAQPRRTIVSTFGGHGYRTVALMPGLQFAWPEGAFYRFDHIYDERQMAYTGPDFGWWTVPDQFALARFDSLEASSGVDAGTPRFVFFPTTSTHAPFTPTAPYQPDWQRLLTKFPFDWPDVEQAWGLQPDYLDLSPAYVRAISYDYQSLAGYLRLHATRDLVLVMIGDHQPAAAVAGERASWDVPVHIVTGRPALIERLRARGFQDGMTPRRPGLGALHALLPTLLGVFGDRSADTTRTGS